jgi:PleD family two-component response regulator
MQSLTDETIISRYGGEEFLIVLPDTKHDSAMTIAEQIRLSIANHAITVEDGITFNVTTSLGLYTLTHEERNCIKQAQEILAQREASNTAVETKKAKSRAIKFMGSQVNHPVSNDQPPHDICQRLICAADQALYEAKARGRNQVVSANEMYASREGVATSLYGT